MQTYMIHAEVVYILHADVYITCRRIYYMQTYILHADVYITCRHSRFGGTFVVKGMKSSLFLKSNSTLLTWERNLARHPKTGSLLKVMHCTLYHT